ncbi:hypothetical protein MKX01_000528 [Papaver californicum]|nr:hypothetical protein MKX01_000528 [Papaver californicum]
MGRTIQVYGFPSYVNAEMVKEFLENYTVRDLARDFVPKPRVSVFQLQAPALHFGCQVSDDCFHVIWKGLDVTVDFEFGFRKLSFLLSDCDVEYKLGLPYESIWRIHLHRTKSRSTQILLIQMFAAPKVYVKYVSSSDGAYADSTLQYCKDTFEDKCVRTTDFTQSCSIGQSSAMCLELPYDCDLPDFHENFPYYKDDKKCFTLQSGSTFSQCSDLVPIVASPQGLELPYDFLFKVSSLVQYGCLSGPTLDKTFFRMVYPRFIPAGHIELTPSKVYFWGPEVNVSNRVLRHYHEHIDNCIRISFVDENWEKIRSADLSSRVITSHGIEKHTGLYRRVLSTLINGIVIGDKKFDFLVFSSSQLRDNSAWMFASVGTVTASRIREWMGDFREIRNVAKYAAGLGQSFGSLTETLNVYTHEIELIPDIEIERNETKYTFSDGIGNISSEFAREVASKCGLEGFTPAAFQIRYGGYKGVFSLRESMYKFKSQNTKLDVLAWSKYQPCFLNRQVISLLSTLGVSDSVFEKKQKEVIEQLDLSLTDPLRAYEALEIMSPGESTNILKEMLLCGYKPDQEPFLSMMLQTFRASKLYELRTRTWIFVPRGRSMMGCLDENRILDYGQVFIQVSSVGSKHFHGDSFSKLSLEGSDGNNFVVVGKVVVAKNPCLHPGDVRVLRAVDMPALHHMVDCVVFPQKGKRPHPNECSVSDLDGDVYFICWDPELIPPCQIQPMDYAAAPSVLLDHGADLLDIANFYCLRFIIDLHYCGVYI